MEAPKGDNVAPETAPNGLPPAAANDVAAEKENPGPAPGPAPNADAVLWLGADDGAEAAAGDTNISVGQWPAETI